MYARVTSFEGGEAAAIRATAQDISGRAGTGPPEGVPAVGFTLLIDPDGRRVLAIALFKTEEDLRAGDAVLSEMTPPGEGMGTRGPVDVYEVAVDLRFD